jgi:sulfur carrier protein
MIIVNNRDKLDWIPGMTVQDVLTQMGYTYVLITVTINGTFVPTEEYDSYPVPDEADVRAIHIMHGG